MFAHPLGKNRNRLSEQACLELILSKPVSIESPPNMQGFRRDYYTGVKYLRFDSKDTQKAYRELLLKHADDLGLIQYEEISFGGRFYIKLDIESFNNLKKSTVLHTVRDDTDPHQPPNPLASPPHRPGFRPAGLSTLHGPVALPGLQHGALPPRAQPAAAPAQVAPAFRPPPPPPPPPRAQATPSPAPATRPPPPPPRRQAASSQPAAAPPPQRAGNMLTAYRSPQTQVATTQGANRLRFQRLINNLITSLDNNDRTAKFTFETQQEANVFVAEMRQYGAEIRDENVVETGLSEQPFILFMGPEVLEALLRHLGTEATPRGNRPTV